MLVDCQTWISGKHKYMNDSSILKSLTFNQTLYNIAQILPKTSTTVKLTIRIWIFFMPCFCSLSTLMLKQAKKALSVVHYRSSTSRAGHGLSRTRHRCGGAWRPWPVEEPGGWRDERQGGGRSCRCDRRQGGVGRGGRWGRAQRSARRRAACARGRLLWRHAVEDGGGGRRRHKDMWKEERERGHMSEPDERE
jgi:hypothetical protein